MDRLKGYILALPKLRGSANEHEISKTLSEVRRKRSGVRGGGGVAMDNSQTNQLLSNWN